MGVEKQQEIDLMYSDQELGAMFVVKQALDGADRFNPRKIFPLPYFPSGSADPSRAPGKADE